MVHAPLLHQFDPFYSYHVCSVMCSQEWGAPQPPPPPDMFVLPARMFRRTDVATVQLWHNIPSLLCDRSTSDPAGRSLIFDRFLKDPCKIRDRSVTNL